MPVAINISNKDVKLVSARHDVLERWVVAPLPNNAVKDGQILQPGAVAGVIDSLLKLLQLPRTQIIASVSGMSFTYRWLKLPQIKPARLRQAIERATQKEIHVPLEELFIDWQIIDDNASGIEVFVLGVPRSQIEPLLQTFKLLHLELGVVDLKSLALARVSGLRDALIVDFESACFNLIILAQGVPVTLHSFNPRSTKASLEDNVRLLMDELDRTIDFYNLTHKDHPVVTTTPLVLTGEMAADPAALNLVRQYTAHPLQTLIPRLKIPAEFPVSTFASNLGSVLKNTSQIRNRSCPAGYRREINVDPLRGRKRIFSHPISFHQYRLPVALLAAVLLIAVLSLIRNKEAAITAALQKESDNATRNLFLGNLVLSENEKTKDTISQLEDETSALERERRSFSGQGQLSAILKLVKESLPADAHLTRITFDPQTVTVEAVSSQRADAIAYTKKLAEAGQFTEVRIQMLDDLPAGSAGPVSPSPAVFKIIIER